MRLVDRLKHAISGCQFKSKDTKCFYNELNDTFTITERCYLCGKNFSFTAPAYNFGYPVHYERSKKYITEVKEVGNGES